MLFGKPYQAKEDSASASAPPKWQLLIAELQDNPSSRNRLCQKASNSLLEHIACDLFRRRLHRPFEALEKDTCSQRNRLCGVDPTMHQQFPAATFLVEKTQRRKHGCKLVWF